MSHRHPWSNPNTVVIGVRSTHVLAVLLRLPSSTFVWKVDEKWLIPTCSILPIAIFLAFLGLIKIDLTTVFNKRSARNRSRYYVSRIDLAWQAALSTLCRPVTHLFLLPAPSPFPFIDQIETRVPRLVFSSQRYVSVVSGFNWIFCWFCLTKH
jgi:hypothetical protein